MNCTYYLRFTFNVCLGDAGEAEHISDPQQHDAEHLDDDAHRAALQPDQLDLRGRRHAQGASSSC